MIKVSAIITSGGSSRRFGSNKLLEKLGDFSVIETTILKYMDLVDEIVVPSSEEIEQYLKNSKIYCSKIKFAPSGITRQKSVYNGLLACSNPKIVLIHDGARPFIEKSVIQKAIEMTFEKKAVLVGAYAIDTIKEVKDGKIVKTLNRDNIFHAQTPQCFDFELIKKIHEIYKDKDDFTDDASMAEAFGAEVFILNNEFDNRKITFKKDLLSANGLC